MISPHPPVQAVRDAVERALAEDLLPMGDLTAALLDPNQRGRGALVSRADGVVAGRLCADEAFRQVDPTLLVTWQIDDGDTVTPGGVLGWVEGRLASILTAERTALNFLCHLSGVATLTARYVAAAAGRATILDTRKTTPGLRALEKAAVRAGGGSNHRGSLSEFVLVKDNHLTGLSIAEAVERARDAWPARTVEVECDRLEQVKEAVAAGADVVMLDNMTSEEVSECVTAVDGACYVEVSGGVNLETVSALAGAGPDFISVGALTHSAPVLDIGLDLGSVRKKMLLALDVGNTETVVGLYSLGADSALLDHWRFHTNVERTSDEHAVLITQFLDMQDATFEDDITGIVLASSVPRVTASFRDMAERYAAEKALVLEPGVKTGMPILYENPKDVGPDRIADAVAAYDLYGGPTIVVDFGTGTTVEGVSERGEYLGGAIMPGVEISLEALFGRTSLLHKAELVEPRSVIGKTTAESIQSGALYGFAAQVDGIVRRFEAEMGESTVVATGGLSGLIVPFSETIEHHDPWLTLHGLRLIYQRNQSD